MKSRINLVGNGKFATISIDQLKVQEKCLMAIDGATENTGVAIVRERDSALIATMAFTREGDIETGIKYKVQLKRELLKIFENNPNIVNVFYEEPYIGYKKAVDTLFSLRTSVQELIYENEPSLDYLSFAEVNNMVWKKRFLAPDKCPTGTDKQKEAVKNKMLKIFPVMALKEYNITQDEIDATGLGLVASLNLRQGSIADIESKKTNPFAYEMKFIGADDDDTMVQSIFDLGVPSAVLENGIKMENLKKSTEMDKQIYKKMGEDDKLLIFKFPSTKFSNLVLKYKVGMLTAQYDWIYLIVWRKYRKKAKT